MTTSEQERLLGLSGDLIQVRDWRGFVVELPAELADANALKGLCGHDKDIFKCKECERESIQLYWGERSALFA